MVQYKQGCNGPFLVLPTSFTILLPHMDISLKLLITLSFASFTTGTLLRSLSRHTHAVIPVKQDLGTGEELVDLLERQQSGLGVEEVDEGNEEGVEDTEVDVRLPANV